MPVLWVTKDPGFTWFPLVPLGSAYDDSRSSFPPRHGWLVFLYGPPKMGWGVLLVSPKSQPKTRKTPQWISQMPSGQGKKRASFLRLVEPKKGNKDTGGQLGSGPEATHQNPQIDVLPTTCPGRCFRAKSRSAAATCTFGHRWSSLGKIDEP